MKNPVIVSAVRTPIGRLSGCFKDFPAVKLGAIAIEDAVKKAGIEKSEVNEVIMGMVLQAGMGQNPARHASIYAGLPVETGSFTVNKVCGSGMKAVMLAANAIKAGEYDTLVAGGMESMTRAPYVLHNARSGYRLGDGKLVDAMVNDGLWDFKGDHHMGLTGERIAERFDLTREDIDSLALRSHQLAVKAGEEGKFKNEITPVEVPQRKRDPIVVENDEGPRADSSMERLARLRPAFKKDGLVTAGNASQISDGACALVIMDEEKASEKGLDIMARIVDYNTAGVEPAEVMYAPVPAMYDILKRNDLTIDDIDLVEHNEAFASASVAVQREFSIPEDRFNVHGGAVALGHPIGCSGARILTTMVHAMKDRNVHRGLASVCLGGGQATSMIVEM